MHSNPKTRKSRNSTANTPSAPVSSPQQSTAMSPPGMQTTASIAASSPQKNASPGLAASGMPVNMAALMGGIATANTNSAGVEGGIQQQAATPQGVNPVLYAQLLQLYPQVSTMPPQVVQQMVLQFQVRMAAAAAAAAANNGQANNMNAVPNPGLPVNGQSGQSAINNLNLNLMTNMFNNPNSASLGANAGVNAAGTNFQNAANGLGANHAAMSALMVNNPNLAANMKMMQLFRQQQHLMNLQNANNAAGLSGGVATGGPTTGALPPNMNPAMAAYFGRNALNGATPQTMQLFNNARNTAALAANSNSGAPDAPSTPAAVNTGSPANTGTDATVNGSIVGQQQPPTPQQPQLNQGAQAIANMSAQEISVHRNTLFTRVQAIVAAINRPGITEMEKLTLLLNRLTMQMQMTQLDHFLKLKSGIVIQPAEAEATKNAVNQLKLNIANVRARISMQQGLAQAQPGLAAPMPQMGADPNTVMNPNTSAPVSAADSSATSNLQANAAMAQVSNSIAQYTQQQSAVGAAPAVSMRPAALLNQQSAQNMIQSVSPQQSRPLFGGTEAYLGGTATGPVSTLQGFLAKSIHELPQASMEERLRALIDDSSAPGIDSDRGSGSRRKLSDLSAEIDAFDMLDSGVEDVLYTLVDDFIDHVTQAACKMAKHRHSKVAKIKDFQFPLERSWNLRIPTTVVHPPPAGSNTPGLQASTLASTATHSEHNSISIRPPPKRFPTPNHISRSIQVKKALRDDQIHLTRQRTLEAQKLREAAGGAEGGDEEEEEPDTSDVEAEEEEEANAAAGGADEEREPENAAGSDEVEMEGDGVVLTVGTSATVVDQ
ncbi:putative tRNA threonylcarbamoyladenosine biosynthesis protein kae1 [Chytriomyces hyalinus]|nr:putative tRNA threonylcarbamoyladenosine biosynthesis protein kae1 [Chytriomyces hyalinus]